MTNRQDIQMLINQVKKQDRRIHNELRLIEDLERRARLLSNYHLLERRPKAYTLEFSFTPGNKTAQTQSFTVSEGQQFEAHAISTSLTVVGQAAVDTDGAGTLGAGQIANITAGYGAPSFSRGPSNRQRFFDFFWKIRDTGGDFSMQDVEQPSVVLSSGHAAPTLLPVPARLSLGTTVAADVTPILNRASITDVFGDPREGLFNVSEYKLLFKFWGEELL